MKILHVIDSMDPSAGGPPQVCANIAVEQAKSNEVHICSYSDNTTCEKLVEGSSVRFHQVFPLSMTEKFLGTNSKTVLSEIVENFDFVHIHNVWESILLSASKAAIKLNVPYCVTPHGMLDPWSLSQKRWKKQVAMRLGRAKLLENASFVHALNAKEQVGIGKLNLKCRFEIVPNGVALDQILPLFDKGPFCEKYPGLAEKPFVLFLARLHYKKGLDILAEAAGIFLEKFPKWQIVIAGPDGGAKEAFEKRIGQLQLNSQVHLLGPIYGDLKYSLVKAAEVFVLPSRQEGFSVAILEAMAAANPVVITENCNFDEVAANECGIVTALKYENIADALASLASDPGMRERLGRSGRALVERDYTWAKVCQLLQSKYQSI